MFAVSSKAYVVHKDWQSAGLEQWKRLEDSRRDYFLAPPTRGLDGLQEAEISYSVATGWSRALVYRYAVSHEAEEVGAAISKHYSEHSGRAWLPSAAQALGAEESQLEVLGGWQSKASRAYMRSVGEKMRLIQAEVARHIRDNIGTRDVVGEDRLLRELERHLAAQGHDAERIKGLLEPLAIFKEPPDDARRWTVGECMPGTPRDAASTIADSSMTTEAPATSEERGRRLPSEISGYVASISRKHGFRRLRCLGKCHRVPGVDYANFEELGDAMLGPSKYDDVCGQCWRAKAVTPENTKDGTASGSVTAMASRDDDAAGSGSECSVDDSSSTEA